MTSLASNRSDGVRRVTRKLLLSGGVLLLLLIPCRAQGQAQGTIPPDVQAIMDKLSSGKIPTAAEQKRLQDWAASQAAKFGQGARGTGAGQPAETAKTGPQSQGPQNGAQISLKSFCPAAAGAPLPAMAPTAAEYVALIKSLVSRYGAKLAPETRISIDAGVAAPKNGSLGASYGAILNAAGAINEAVYAAATAVQKNPGDLLAANNLGVNLSEAGDHQSSAQVLLYVTRMRPNSPLASLNLGWTYFNAGASAPAQKEFQRASGLAPDMSGPEAGLGLLAACRGDKTTALRLLKSSLSKGYSGVAAPAFVQAKASQPPSDTAQDQKAQNQSGSEGNPPPPSNQSALIPDLPLHPEGQRNVPQIDALKRVGDWAEQRNNELMQRFMDASARVAALNRRAKQAGDAINLPMVFDRELFEFRQVIDLTFTARFRNMDPTIKEITQVMNTNGNVTTSILLPELQHFNEQQLQLIELLKDMAACGDNDSCKVKVEKQIDAKKAEMEETAYQICMHSKQSIDVTYVQSYKHWKTAWDDFRPAAADLYAFTDPILRRVWVPALNEMLQTQRELTVMSMYHPLSMEAAAIAANGKAYEDLKCVPPAPPPTTENADTPNLKQDPPPECPFGKPVAVGCGLISMTLGCDQVSIKGGEGIRIKVERNFKTHETTLWAGAGASAEAKMDFLGPASPKAELTAEVGMGVKFGQDGAVTDIFVTSELSAGASIAGKSLDMSASGTAALEGGATLTGSLPGGLGGTIRN